MQQSSFDPLIIYLYFHIRLRFIAATEVRNQNASQKEEEWQEKGQEKWQEVS